MRRTIIIVCLLCVHVLVNAQSVPSLLLPGDASSTVAPTVLMNVDRAFESNPAAAVFAPGRFGAWAGGAAWAPKTAGTTIIAGGASARFGDKIAVAVSYRSLADKPYEIVSASGSVTGTFTPADKIISLGSSFKIGSSLGAGLMLRYLTSAIGTDLKGSTFCADLSLFYSKEALSAGLSVRNLGGKISWGDDAYALPLNASLGAAYSVAGLKAGLEVNYLFEGAFGAGVGAEYLIADIATVRAGYHLGDKSKGLTSYVSLGLGAKFAGVCLDAAYLLASETLGGSLVAGLSYSF